MHPSLRLLALGTFLSLGGAPALAAQVKDKDAQEIAAYRLTMDAVRKLQVAMRTFEDGMKKDPRYQEYAKVQAEIEVLEAKEELTDAEQERLERLEARLESIQPDTDMGDAETIDEMVAEVARIPALGAALRQAGLPPREYAVFTLALMQASLYVGMKRAGMAREMPKGLNPANVRFIEEHAAELEAIQKENAKRSKGS